MRPRIALVTGLLIAAACAPASAAPLQNPHGKVLGSIPARALGVPHARFAAPVLADASGNLDYHNGPVMHSNTTYAIYWAPPGYSFASGYQSTIDSYLSNVAADSGKPTNVYSTDEQYTDGTGRAAYSSTFAGSITVHDALPATQCSDPGTSACVTDAQIQTEIDSVLTANSLPRGLGRLYFLVTPAGVGSCAGSDCAYTNYCAYHSWFGSGTTTLYANIPWGDTPGCSSPESPNQNSADSALGSLSHEHNETITDPTGDAWWDDFDGSEDGDKCAWDYGQSLGFTAGGTEAYNELIAGGTYYLQQEWDNASHSCKQRLATAAATASFSWAPRASAAGDQVEFDGSASQPSPGVAPPLSGYRWDFGDGTSGTGSVADHVYGHPGTYSVTLTVTDAGGGLGGATHQVAVSDRPPVASLQLPATGAVAGRALWVDGSGSSDPDGSVSSYRWDFGDGNTASGPVASHVYAAAGSYDVTLQVVDNLGLAASATQRVLVGQPPAPAAAITGVTPHSRAGHPTSFDASTSRSENGAIVRYAWDFGDGRSGAGSRPRHSYRAAGSYAVTLTVTDALGRTATTERLVRVSPSAKPSASLVRTALGLQRLPRIAALAASGLPVSLPCLAICVGRAQLSVSAEVARKLGLHGHVLASAATVGRGPAPLRFELRLAPRLRTRLRSLSTLPATVTIAVGRSTIRQALTLSR